MVCVSQMNFIALYLGILLRQCFVSLNGMTLIVYYRSKIFTYTGFILIESIYSCLQTVMS